MAFDDACHVRHAAVTEFDVKFVAKFVEAVVWGEGLVDEIEELFANTCFDFNVVCRVAIFSLPKKRTFFDNDYYQPYKLFCKAGKIFLDICWTLTAFDN